MKKPVEEPSGDFALVLGDGAAQLVCHRFDVRLFQVWVSLNAGNDFDGVCLGIGASRADALREALDAITSAKERLEHELYMVESTRARDAGVDSGRRHRPHPDPDSSAAVPPFEDPGNAR